MLHNQRIFIEAYLTASFAALAVARHLQDVTEVSIKKLAQALRPLVTVRIDIDGHELTTVPTIDADEILNSVTVESTHQMRDDKG
ncbi:hypothetical protein F7P69_14855 [Cellulosimicrobium funkei]|nr:hypothetical protein [Cellulosimicrobium funkei]